MKLAKNLERLGTETAFSVLAEAKKLEAQGKEMGRTFCFKRRNVSRRCKESG